MDRQLGRALRQGRHDVAHCEYTFPLLCTAASRRAERACQPAFRAPDRAGMRVVPHHLSRAHAFRPQIQADRIHDGRARKDTAGADDRRFKKRDQQRHGQVQRPAALCEEQGVRAGSHQPLLRRKVHRQCGRLCAVDVQQRHHHGQHQFRRTWRARQYRCAPGQKIRLGRKTDRHRADATQQSHRAGHLQHRAGVEFSLLVPERCCSGPRHTDVS